MTTQFKTVTGRSITVTPNNKQRTFTIETKGAKYETIKYNGAGFDEMERMTGNDWQAFLQLCNDEYTTL